MADFCNTILKAISNYKLILRKSLTATQCTAKMLELGIKRQHVRKANSEIMLYQLGLKIKDELTKQIGNEKSNKSSNFYHGTGEFLQYLEDLFAHYRIENDRVVHVGQRVSSIVVEAIQLIALSKGKLIGAKAKQVIKYSEIVATYGSKEQKTMFLNAIGSRQKHLVKDIPPSMFD